MADADDLPVAPAADASKNKILPVILILNTLLLSGVLVFVMKRPAASGGDVKNSDDKHEAAAGESGAAKGATQSLGPMTRFDNFTVQLKSADVDRYARLSLELESPNDISKAAVEKRVPPIRDAVLGYLTDRTVEELRGSEGLKQVKQALLTRLEEIVPGNHVRNIFITDFIIQ